MAFYEATRDNTYCNVESFLTSGTLPHFHSTIEILLVEKGQIEINLNGRTHILLPGDIVFCNSFDIHAFKILEKDTVGVVWMIPQAHIKNINGANKGRRYEKQVFSDPECVSELNYLNKLMNNHPCLTPNDYNLANALGQVVFTLVTKRLELCDKKSDETDTMKKVLFYLYDNFTEDLTLKKVSARFGYTPNHFSSLFNSYMQVSLTSFINNLRADHSAHLLRKGMSVIEASENSGFGSLRTFYRCFKEKYNVTPVEYTQNKQNINVN